MLIIKQTKETPYKIIIGKNIISNLDNILSEELKIKNALIITDENISNIYGKKIIDILSLKINVKKYIVPTGEISKTYECLIDIQDYMSEQKITRDDAIIALGGGSISDISGFAASTYKRGIKLINIASTLLAQVDASIGGKNGINTKYGKNMIGSFYNPDLVVCDTSMLDTLPSNKLKDGIAEIIKYCAIKQNKLFDKLSNNDYDENVEKTVELCIKTKLDIIGSDLKDNGNRMLLNFGHTLGHAIEKASNYKVSHGHAISIGMAMITKLSAEAKFSEKESYQKLVHILNKFDLPTKTNIKMDIIIENILNDKKIIKNGIKVILIRKIGKAEIKQFSIKNFIKFLKGGYKDGIVD